jgi:hypothetical protein
MPSLTPAAKVGGWVAGCPPLLHLESPTKLCSEAKKFAALVSAEGKISEEWAALGAFEAFTLAGMVHAKTA